MEKIIVRVMYVTVMQFANRVVGNMKQHTVLMVARREHVNLSLAQQVVTIINPAHSIHAARKLILPVSMMH